LSEDWFEVVKVDYVDYDIASIPFFRINVPQFSKSVWFGIKTIRMEPDDKVGLREMIRPPHLFPDQHLSSRKGLKIFVIHNNINGIG